MRTQPMTENEKNEFRFLNMLKDTFLQQYVDWPERMIDIDAIQEKWLVASESERVMLKFLKVVWAPYSEWFPEIDDYCVLTNFRRLDRPNSKKVQEWVLNPYRV